MLINKNTFFGIDELDVQQIAKDIVPLWDKDPGIDGMLLDVSKILVGAKVIKDGKVVEDWACDSIPKYVFTNTTSEICSKIKISSKTVSMIQEVSSTDKSEENRPFDIMGHISFKNKFYRYIIIMGRVFVVCCYLYNDPDGYVKSLTLADYQRFTPAEIKLRADNAIFIGYSVWSMPMGADPSLYELQKWHVEFFQALMFLKYTKPEYKFVPAQKKIGTKKSGFTNATSNSVTVVDSNWNMIVIRDEGFSVEGHLRLQAYGPNHSQRKFIWIKPFEKSGYIRKGKGVSELNNS